MPLLTERQVISQYRRMNDKADRQFEKFRDADQATFDKAETQWKKAMDAADAWLDHALATCR